MSDIVKVNWSGGKDSTCAVYEHIEQGHYVKAICYIPMFTNDIPMILKSHYDFIMRTAQKFREKGCEVYIVSGMTYWDYVTHISLTGKYKGLIFGFPHFARGQCGFKRDSKLKALNSIDVGIYDYEDIGIAFDEVDRHNQLNDKRRSILVERKITEAQATQRCLEKDSLSPHYSTGRKRDGCTLCPNASEKERQQWYLDYPQSMEKLIELQNIVKIQRPERFPLRNHKYFIEDGVLQ